MSLYNEYTVKMCTSEGVKQVRVLAQNACDAIMLTAGTLSEVPRMVKAEPFKDKNKDQKMRM